MIARVAKIMSVVLLLSTLAACQSSTNQASTAPSPHGANGKWKVVMIQSYSENSYMIQRNNAIRAAASHDPIASKIDFRLVQTATTDEALNQAIDNALTGGVDALMFMAVSDTGSNAEVKKACAQGVYVFTYDNPANQPAINLSDGNLCNRILFFKFKDYMTQVGSWVGKLTNCTGQILADQGAQGIQLAKDIYDGWGIGLQQACGAKFGSDIKIVGNFYGQFSNTVPEGLVSALLAAHPQANIVLSEAYGAPIAAAFKAAGAPTPIMTISGASNETFQLCDPAAHPGVHCFITGNSPLGSNWVLDRLYDILVKKDNSLPYFSEWQMTWASTDANIDIGLPHRDVQPVQLNVNVLPNLPPSFYPYYRYQGLYYTPSVPEMLQGLH
jgi:ABC-type sugar transport system substrate-binding protein